MEEKKSNPLEHEEEDANGIDDIDTLSSCSSPHSVHSLKPWNVSSITNEKHRTLIVSKLKKMKITEPIILNIGGSKYATSINTLLKHHDSLFYKMFNGVYMMKPNRDKSFFIDRDGTHFRHILNFLRHGQLIIDANDEMLKRELLLEAQYYQIHALIHMLSPKIDSLIISEHHLKVLESWIAFELLRPNTVDRARYTKPENPSNADNNLPKSAKLHFKLLYRASRHGFESSAFHRLCDHKKNTLVVIKANDSIIGGMTSIPWEAPNDGRAVDQINQNIKSRKTFTFLLESESDVWKHKYSLYSSEKWDYCGSNKLSYVHNPCYSVYHHKSFGPVFGYRPCFDYNGDVAAHIVIGDKCNVNLNSRIDSFIGEHLSVRKHMTDSFFVFDYEVFQIVY